MAIVTLGLVLADSLHIVVGPNVRVSRSSPAPRVEMQIAANPTNAKNLVGAAIVTEQDGDRCKAYVSFDGGFTWHEHTFDELPETGSGDPQVAFGPDGTAYFTALGLVRSGDGTNHFSMIVLRSGDGGRTWQHATTVGAGYAPDHEQLVIDGRTGRLYLSVGHRSAVDEENVGIFRSDTHGESPIGPLHVASGNGSGLFTLNPVVFSDGSLFVPMLVSEPKRLAERQTPTADIYFARSSDGGFTVPQPKKIRTQTLDPRYTAGSPYASVVFAVDSGARYRDRLYMVWGEASGGHYHLIGSYSTDKGQSWSQPRRVGNPPTDADQFRPAVAVSAQGVLGVAWLDTRNTGGSRVYNEYFAASIDGGDTFLPAVRVSSRASPLDARDNDVLRPTIDSPRRGAASISLSLITTRAGFPDGGDYLGLAADAAGAFHPLWADARAGSFQAWTATVKIENAVPDSHEFRASASQAVTDKLEPLFDPASYDSSTGVEEIPIRLQNISSDSICAPIVAHAREEAGGRTGEPAIAGDRSADYSHSMGMFSCLAPGEATEPVVWRVHARKPNDTFVTLELTVTGARPPK